MRQIAVLFMVGLFPSPKCTGTFLKIAHDGFVHDKAIQVDSPLAGSHTAVPTALGKPISHLCRASTGDTLLVFPVLVEITPVGLPIRLSVAIIVSFSVRSVAGFRKMTACE